MNSDSDIKNMMPDRYDYSC